MVPTGAPIPLHMIQLKTFPRALSGTLVKNMLLYRLKNKSYNNLWRTRQGGAQGFHAAT